MFNENTFIRDMVDDFDSVVGIKEPKEPKKIYFRNEDKALEMLHKHIVSSEDTPITIHCDVDVDGIGCGYILGNFLNNVCKRSRINYVINKKKKHGLNEKYIEAFSNNTKQLLIVVDSGSNNIEIVKEINCDVLILDHHNVSHEEYCGNTVGGSFVLINNRLNNNNLEWLNNKIEIKEIRQNNFELEPYIGEPRMSGAMVVYELLRVYEEVYKTGPIIEKGMLYQWVGVTLFSDSILLGNSRNQYYINKTVHNTDTEPGLYTMIQNLNKWNQTLSKGVIEYSLASLFNSTIRAGYSSLALDIALNRQSDINDLKYFKEIQDKKLTSYMEGVFISDTFCIKVIPEDETSENYCGLFANKILGETGKNSVTVIYDGTNVHGSFRGKSRTSNYRKEFAEFKGGRHAEGHDAAFGFNVAKDELVEILTRVSDIDKNSKKQFYLTAGIMKSDDMGKYHIDKLEDFKEKGWFWKLAVANSNLSGLEEINIITSNMGLEPKSISSSGKAYYYDILGLECMAFEPLTTELIELYVEYQNQVKVYARNKKWR